MTLLKNHGEVVYFSNWNSEMDQINFLIISCFIAVAAGVVVGTVVVIFSKLRKILAKFPIQNELVIKLFFLIICSPLVFYIVFVYIGRLLAEALYIRHALTQTDVGLWSRVFKLYPEYISGDEYIFIFVLQCLCAGWVAFNLAKLSLRKRIKTFSAVVSGALFFGGLGIVLNDWYLFSGHISDLKNNRYISKAEIEDVYDLFYTFSYHYYSNYLHNFKAVNPSAWTLSLGVIAERLGIILGSVGGYIFASQRIENSKTNLQLDYKQHNYLKN